MSLSSSDICNILVNSSSIGLFVSSSILLTLVIILSVAFILTPFVYGSIIIFVYKSCIKLIYFSNSSFIMAKFCIPTLYSSILDLSCLIISCISLFSSKPPSSPSSPCPPFILCKIDLNVFS